MRKYEKTFKVSLNQEAKDAGQSNEVTVTFLIPDDKIDFAIEQGIKTEVIRLQSQGRNNPGPILDGSYPKEITIGENWVGTGKRRTTVVKRELTEEEKEQMMFEYMSLMTDEEKSTFFAGGGLPKDITARHAAWKASQ